MAPVFDKMIQTFHFMRDELGPEMSKKTCITISRKRPLNMYDLWSKWNKSLIEPKQREKGTDVQSETSHDIDSYSMYRQSTQSPDIWGGSPYSDF